MGNTKHPLFGVRRVRALMVVFGVVGAGALLLLFTFTNIGIGQDDAAIMLAATELPAYHLWSPGDLQHNLLFRLFNYSHGWMNLVWTYVVYAILGVLRIPLATWALVLPGSLLVWGTAWCVYLLARELRLGRAYELLASGFFLTTPIVLGLARSYTIQLPVAMFVRAMTYLLLTRALMRRSEHCRTAAIFAMGVLVVSENAFPFSIALGVLLVMLHRFADAMHRTWWKRLMDTARETARFFFHPATAIGLMFLAWYAVAYYIESLYPFGYGFFRFTRLHPIQWNIPHEFPQRFLDHFGIGLTVALSLLVGTTVVVRMIGVHRERRPAVRFLIVWAAVSSLLPFLYWPDNAMVYSALAAPPFAVLLALALAAIARRSTVVGIVMSSCVVIAQLLSDTALVFDRPYPAPNLYGAPRGYAWSEPFKAVGTILRREGFHPDRYRTATPDPYRVVLAGNPSPVVLYPAVLYWGTVPIVRADAQTSHVVVIRNRDGAEDFQTRRAAITYAKTNSFGLAHLVVDREEPVAWVYERGYDGPVWFHDRVTLMRDWDREFAQLENIKVPGRAGPHAL